MSEHDFSDADFGEAMGPIVMGWNTTEGSYSCHSCEKDHARLPGPAFFRVIEDKKLKPMCFECVRDIGGEITNDQDSGNMIQA